MRARPEGDPPTRPRLFWFARKEHEAADRSRPRVIRTLRPVLRRRRSEARFRLRPALATLPNQQGEPSSDDARYQTQGFVAPIPGACPPRRMRLTRHIRPTPGAI